MIEIKGLCKGYGERILYENMNLTITDGEFVVINGESGSGKTTLLNIIGSLEAPDKGSILVNGKDIYKNGRNQREYLQHEVSFLFQNFALLENKTVRENLEIIKKSVRTEYTIEQALDYVGLSDKIDTKVYQLSGGEQQRAALARTMIKQGNIILADEPTGSLDKKNARRVMDILKQLNGMGKTIIMVTHEEAYKSMGTRIVNIGGNC